jgi:hypothetical protein
VLFGLLLIFGTIALAVRAARAAAR